MEFHFTKEDALKYGLEEATLLYNLKFWLIKNKANGKNFINGRYWTYNSCSAFAKIFPFWSEQKIGRLLRDMENKEIIISANFNKNKMDKSKWYSVVDESFMKDIEESSSSSDCSEINNDCSDLNNGMFKNELSIYTYNKPYIKTSYKKEIIKEKFVKPTIEEIRDYSNEINAGIDAKQFYYFYESKGWMIGKNKMKSWKAALRTWERKSKTNNVANEFLELGREE